ncbi:MAG TPA: Na(+)-translocating NADH-quinone reductase subunit C [Candidatus Phocaeicola excrementigallinarum]|nr:Na(+)-translocating NADH-quinone reductase subunit C [Candidatus Phocaeicola excrementigallinarum]
MNTNSNSYTLVYASVLVVIVAFLLAFVNSSLRDLQGKNVELDTKNQILSALNIRTAADVEAEFDKVVKEDQIVAEDGSLTPYDGKFVTGYEKEFKENGRAHVFVCEVDGQTKYVIPVYGAGLWGAIWGYVALNEDKNTVFGTYFSHASETPGLGAEIAGEHFQNEFKDKHVMDGGNVALSVVKFGKVENPDCQVDGISGGTITSNGVNAMLESCLKHYSNFLTSKN